MSSHLATANNTLPSPKVQLLHAVVTLDYDAVERLASAGPLQPYLLALEAIAYDDAAMLELLFDLKLETPDAVLLLAAAWHGCQTEYHRQGTIPVVCVTPAHP